MLQSSISNFQPSQVFVSDFSLGISSSIRSRLLSSSGRDNVGLATKHRSHPRDARVAGGVSGPATAGTAGSAGNARSAGSASASAKGLSGFSEAGLQIDDLNFISYNKLYIILYIYIYMFTDPEISGMSGSYNNQSCSKHPRYKGVM